MVDEIDNSKDEQDVEVEEGDIVISPEDLNADLPRAHASIPEITEGSDSLLPELSFEKSSSEEVIRYDPLESYLSEIRHVPQLSREEEHRLAIRYKELGDKMAGYQLVLSNLRLVVMIAREY